MPIFLKKSSPKGSAPRTGRLPESVFPRIKDDIDDVRNISLHINEKKQLRFVDGIWIQNQGSGQSKTVDVNVDDFFNLKSKLDGLEQENNLLQVKVDILIDLLTENMCNANNK